MRIFGEGFVERAVYTTAVLDFGTPVAWGKIRWDGAFAEGSSVIIRTRSGRDPDPNLYWVPSNIEGEPTQLIRKEFERADLSVRFTTLDEENWSFWSAPYALTAGQRDLTLEAAAWADGTPDSLARPSALFANSGHLFVEPASGRCAARVGGSVRAASRLSGRGGDLAAGCLA